MPFGKEVDDAIKAHAVREYPREACGVVIGGKYVECENVSATPHSMFEIDEAFIAENYDVIEGVAHSHPQVMPFPSKTDMEQQELSGKPWAIASVTCDGHNDPSCMDLFWFGDSLPIIPLLNRPFRPGVQDCYALVRDWYRLRGTVLGICPRDDGWWQDDKHTGKKRQDIFDEYFPNSGWRRISHFDGIKEGDAFVVPYYTEALCHCGVFVGEDEVLHHMSGKLSERVPHWTWLRRAIEGGKLFRHESME